MSAVSKVDKIKEINTNWKLKHGGIVRRRTPKKVSFVESEMKSNSNDKCKCKSESWLMCQLHDNSNPKNAIFYEIVQKYFAKFQTYSEKDLLEQLEKNVKKVENVKNVKKVENTENTKNTKNTQINDLLSFCLKATKESIERLERRKKELNKELFEDKLYDCYIKKRKLRVAFSDDFDPKWDSAYLDAIAAKRQAKYVRVSVIKGGSRSIIGTLQYNHIVFLKKLEELLCGVAPPRDAPSHF